MKNTFTTKADFCQERDFGQKISATFEFLAAHARPLGQCLLYFVLPGFILQGLAQAALQYQTLQLLGNKAAGLGRFQEFSGAYILLMLASTISHTLLAATVYGYVRARLLQPATEPVLPAQVWEQIKARLFTLVLSSIAIGLVVGLGMLFFLIPGIYLAVPLSMAWVVIVLENRGTGDTISRCLSLAKGKWWSTFGLMLVMFFIVAMLATIVSIPNTLLTVGNSLHLSGIPPVVGAALTLVTTTVAGFFYLPLLVAPLFQYFNLVERKEGHGLQELVDRLGQTAAPVAQQHHFQPDDDGEY